MTMASSTSQSNLSLFLGCIMSSFGPDIALVAFVNTYGSAGMVIPDSAAWSA